MNKKEAWVAFLDRKIALFVPLFPGHVREKLAFALGEMRARLAKLGAIYGRYEQARTKS